jgi:hypothetical protein
MTQGAFSRLVCTGQRVTEHECISLMQAQEKLEVIVYDAG